MTMLNRPSLQDRVRQDDDARYFGANPPTVLGCIWHATDSTRWYGSGGTREYLNSGAKQASYNYVITKDGTIVRFVDPSKHRAYHAGVKCTWEPAGSGLIVDGSVNGRTIGVAFIIPNRRGAIITPKALESALWLGDVLMNKYHYPVHLNLQHREVAPTWKSDVIPEILDADYWRELLGRSEWPNPLELVARPGRPAGAVAA